MPKSAKRSVHRPSTAKSIFASLDANRDGQISLKEITAAFRRADTDKSGTLSLKELSAAMSKGRKSAKGRKSSKRRGSARRGAADEKCEDKLYTCDFGEMCRVNHPLRLLIGKGKNLAPHTIIPFVMQKKLGIDISKECQGLDGNATVMCQQKLWNDKTKMDYGDVFCDPDTYN